MKTKTLAQHEFVKGEIYATDDLIKVSIDIERHFSKVDDGGKLTEDATDNELCKKHIIIEVKEVL